MIQARFFDGVRAAGETVALSILGQDLRIERQAYPAEAWPIASLMRVDIDAPGHGATLRQIGGMARLVVADGDFVERLRAQGARLGRAPRRWGVRAWGGIAAGLLAGLALAALLIDRLPSLLVPFVPYRLERVWSSGIETALGAGTRRCVGEPGHRAVATLIGKLAAAEGMKAPDFIVFNDSLVNAFTLPDGRMVILRGLIDESADPDEFAGVLAHELGHMRSRDPTRETLRRLMLNMLARSLGWGGNFGGQMTALSYGRRAESAADATAIETLQRAGLHADGLGHFFDRLRSDGGDGLPAFLSDHPATADRAAALHVDSVGAPAMSPEQWQLVKTMCLSPPP
jgi:Zn-dependent protease with chaperone function